MKRCELTDNIVNGTNTNTNNIRLSVNSPGTRSNGDNEFETGEFSYRRVMRAEWQRNNQRGRKCTDRQDHMGMGL